MLKTVTVKIGINNHVTTIEKVKAEIVDGLAVTPMKNNWTVTHVASGLRIGPCFKNEGDAKIFLKRILPLYDWTKTQAQIQEDMSENSPKALAMVKKLKAKWRDLEVARD